ncbi:MAG TPA: hypothetical protein VM308_06830 [Sphingomicrobium sp.]|nr:hypothetical protein [Sphingomicrobium sp.]
MTSRCRPRVGFLFNHDQVHQVAHALPVALALAEGWTEADIVIATTNRALSEEVRRLGGEAIGTRIPLIELGLKSAWSRLLERLAGRLIPAAKLLVYRDNLDFFRSLDLLVVPEKTSLVLKQRYGLRNLKIVHTRHGAGDRAIGFNRASAGFDLVLASGPKTRDRLISEGGLPPERVAVVGYPKFDLYRWPARPKQRPKRPVVLYNPHPAPHLSSWYKMGADILDWFARHHEYELIFAPHIMLFQRKAVVTIDPPAIARTGAIAPHILAAENIIVDTGSRALTTMEYVSRADIYLGDASSQVYEFLVEPRPCIFVDAHRTEWQGEPDFRHWTAGRVIHSVGELGDALAIAFDEHEHAYKAVQRQLFAETFDLTDRPSAERAAEAIAKFAGIPRKSG